MAKGRSDADSYSGSRDKDSGRGGEGAGLSPTGTPPRAQPHGYAP